MNLGMSAQLGAGTHAQSHSAAWHVIPALIEKIRN